MLLFFFRQLARLPLSWLHRAGAALGWLVYWCSPSYAGRMRENLYASGVCSGEAQCEQLLRAAVAETGATSAKEMGAVMNVVRPKTQGRADGKLVSEVVKAALTPAA